MVHFALLCWCRAPQTGSPCVPGLSALSPRLSLLFPASHSPLLSLCCALAPSWFDFSSAPAPLPAHSCLILCWHNPPVGPGGTKRGKCSSKKLGSASQLDQCRGVTQQAVNSKAGNRSWCCCLGWVKSLRPRQTPQPWWFSSQYLK